MKSKIMATLVVAAAGLAAASLPARAQETDQERS